MKITYYGHSCFELHYDNCSVIIDPFITGNPLAKNIDINNLHPDYILLTHGHQDHVLDAETLAKANTSTIVSNYEIVTWYGGKDIKGHPLNHGGKWKFDFATAKYVNAVHSSVLPDGTYGGNPGGFVLWNDTTCIYHAGDTALTMDMKLIPMTCPKLDVAILPIGDNFTMGIEDALLAAEMIECDKILGCHHSTFGYIEIDKNAAKETFAKAGKELVLLEIGESYNV